MIYHHTMLRWHLMQLLQQNIQTSYGLLHFNVHSEVYVVPKLCSIFAVFGFPKLHGAFLYAIFVILLYLSQEHVTWRFFNVATPVSNYCACVWNLVVFSFKSLFGFQVLVL